MSQSLANVLVHLVFSTKHRQPFLADLELRRQTHSYLAGICNHLDGPTVIVGGVADHVHLLARLGRGATLADWVKELKRASSLWIKTNASGLTEFHWQTGYGAFSVSQSQSARVEAYIAEQETHHQRFSFQDEFRRFLAKHNLAYDERFVWD